MPYILLNIDSNSRLIKLYLNFKMYAFSLTVASRAGNILLILWPKITCRQMLIIKILWYGIGLSVGFIGYITLWWSGILSTCQTVLVDLLFTLSTIISISLIIIYGYDTISLSISSWKYFCKFTISLSKFVPLIVVNVDTF